MLLVSVPLFLAWMDMGGEEGRLEEGPCVGCVPLFAHDNIRPRFNFVFLTFIPMLARSQQLGLVRDDYDWDFWIGVHLLYVARLWFCFFFGFF
jgi:hypothetical protein